MGENGVYGWNLRILLASTHLTPDTANWTPHITRSIFHLPPCSDCQLHDTPDLSTSSLKTSNPVSPCFTSTSSSPRPSLKPLIHSPLIHLKVQCGKHLRSHPSFTKTSLSNGESPWTNSNVSPLYHHGTDPLKVSNKWNTLHTPKLTSKPNLENLSKSTFAKASLLL